MSAGRQRRYVLPQEEVAPAAQPPLPTTQLQTNPLPTTVAPAAPAITIPTAVSATTSPQQLVFPWGNPKINTALPSSTQDPLPPYFRCTLCAIPANQDVATNIKVPLGLVVSPTQVSGAPIIDFSNSNIVRCTQCHSYLSPNVKIAPSGRSWQCPMCGAENQINATPYDPIPFPQRTELAAPVYDMIAPQSYVTNPNAGSCFLFVIDISLSAVSIGLSSQMIASLRSTIPQMPDTCRVGLMTMSDKLSFIDFKRSAEVTLPDLTDLTIPSSVIAQLSECKTVFLDALTSIEKNLTSPQPGNCVGSALQAAEQILTAVGGCLVIGFSEFPIHGPFALKPRNLDNVSEAQLLRLPTDASGKFFRDISFRLNRVGASVHIFAAGEKFSDLSTIAVPSGLTGGSCHFYGNFDDTAKAQFHTDLFSTLTKEYYWDASIRLRCSNGLKISKIHGNFMIREGELVLYPVLTPDTSIVFEISVPTPISTPTSIFQVALLWTTANRQRMIRVFTFTMPVSGSIELLKNGIDETALISVLSRRSLNALLTSGPIEAAQMIRKESAHLSASGAYLPSTIFLSHSLLCSNALRMSNSKGVDGRMETIIRLRSISPTDLLLYLYPRMFSVDENCVALPLNGQSFGAGFCFVVHTVDQIFIWVSKEASAEYLNEVFGVGKIEDLPKELPSLQTKRNGVIKQLIEGCWTLSRRYLPVEIIPCGSPREAIFKDVIVDDSAICGSNLATFITEIRGIQ